MKEVSEEVWEIAQDLYDDADFSVNRYGEVESFEVKSYEDYNGWDRDCTEDDFEKAKKYLEELLDGVKYYNGYLELSNNRTLNYINLPEGVEDFNLEEYDFIVDQAINDLKEEIGTEVYSLGRSGRHICVEDTFRNLTQLGEFKEAQKKWENWVIETVEAEAQGVDEVTESLHNGEKQARCLSCGTDVIYTNRDVLHDIDGDYIECPNCHATFDVDYDNITSLVNKKTEGDIKYYNKDIILDEFKTWCDKKLYDVNEITETEIDEFLASKWIEIEQDIQDENVVRHMIDNLKNMLKSALFGNKVTESYEVWQKYYEDGEIARPEYVQSFDTFEEAQNFVMGLNEDPNCEAWIEELKESKKVTEAEDMEAVKDDVKSAVKKSDSTKQEKDQVKGSINVLKTDEESAIEGYEDFNKETAKVVDKELADTIDNQMQEIVDDEKEHIEKLDTIKSALGEGLELDDEETKFINAMVTRSKSDIEDFLGYDLTSKQFKDKQSLRLAIKEIYEQMPDEEFNKFKSSLGKSNKKEESKEVTSVPYKTEKEAKAGIRSLKKAGIEARIEKQDDGTFVIISKNKKEETLGESERGYITGEVEAIIDGMTDLDKSQITGKLIDDVVNIVSDGKIDVESSEFDERVTSIVRNILKESKEDMEAFDMPRYTVYDYAESNTYQDEIEQGGEPSPFTIYDNELDDFYYDELKQNPVFDTEEEAQDYINKYGLNKKDKKVESSTKPVIVKFWETEEDRDQGLSEIHKTYPADDASIAEAIKEAKHLMNLMSYASVEVYNEDTGDTYYWTDGVDEKYYNKSNELVNDDTVLARTSDGGEFIVVYDDEDDEMEPCYVVRYFDKNNNNVEYYGSENVFDTQEEAISYFKEILSDKDRKARLEKSISSRVKADVLILDEAKDINDLDNNEDFKNYVKALLKDGAIDDPEYVKTLSKEEFEDLLVNTWMKDPEIRADYIKSNVNEDYTKLEEDSETATQELNTDLLPIIDMYQYDIYNGLDNYVGITSEAIDKMMLEFAEPLIEEQIKGVLPSAQITFKEFTHPKYYKLFSNYNDVLDFDVTYNVSEYEALKEKAIQDPAFEQYLKDHYSSYDGFMSFFANNLRDFEEQEDWKQFVSVLSYYLPNDGDSNYSEMCNYILENTGNYDIMPIDSEVEYVVEEINNKVSNGEIELNKENVINVTKDLMSYLDEEDLEIIMSGVLEEFNLEESKKRELSNKTNNVSLGGLDDLKGMTEAKAIEMKKTENKKEGK